MQSMLLPIHETQARFVDSQALIRGFVGGRGAGKSYIGSWDLIQRCRSGKHYMVVAPSYTMLRDTTLRSFQEVARRTCRWQYFFRGEHRAVLRNGASVVFRSGDDPERLRGPNLSGIWLDEASLMRRECFDICIASLREDGEQGWLSATFTPKGRRHWSFAVFGQPGQDTELIHARTLDNPFLPPEFERTVRAQYTAHLAAQELAGEFVDAGGYLFNRAWFGIVDAAPAKLRRIRAWDWAATTPKEGTDPDYTVGALLGKSPEGIFYVLDLRRVRATPKAVELLVKQTADLDGPSVAVWLEREPGASGIALVENYKRLLAGYNVHDEAPTGDKSVRAQGLAAQAEAGNVKLLRAEWNKELLDEIEMFPFGGHDDQVDAAALAFNKLALTGWKVPDIII